MGDWVTTLGIAFVLVAFALAALAIGWLLTGKSRLVRGGCGKLPSEIKKGECKDDQAGCSLCSDDEDKKRP